MRFLADENMPRACVEALRAAGHDLVWVREDAPGMDDTDIFAWAAREGRVLLTFDKDFGEAAVRAGLPGDAGIILFRVSIPPDGGGRLAQIILLRSDWPGRFSVVEPGRVRMRDLPTPPNRP
ncbi:MAG: DUF5615 family PIN-like protein [Terricaulis sp.]|nr:DUF5615 family PIN-like protein [Terricaulis sp.]